MIAQASIFAEVIVIDDGSGDATLETATRLAEELPNLHLRIFTRELVRPSFGGLVRFGMAHAVGRYCAIVSADATDPVDLLPQMLRLLRGGQALGTSSNRFNIFPEMTFKVLESGGTIEYIPGAQQPVGVGGSEKFKLPNEILGYAAVLVRAALHRAGALRWF